MSTAKKKSVEATSAIEAAAENFEATVDMIKGGVDAAIKASTEQTNAAQAFEGVEFPGRENFDAAVKAGEAYVAGFQTLNDLFFKAAKDAVRFNSEAAKTLTGCKTPEEISAAQIKLVQSGFEAAVETGTAIGQTAYKVAGEVSEPLSSKLSSVYGDFAAKTAA